MEKVKSLFNETYLTWDFDIEPDDSFEAEAMAEYER